MGSLLSMLGAGGAMLTLPILVYLFKIPGDVAIGYSMFVVGASSSFGVVGHLKRKSIDPAVFFLFGIPSSIMVVLSRMFLLPLIPDPVFSLNGWLISRAAFLLSIFALLMLSSAFGMIKVSEKINGQKKVIPNKTLYLLIGAIVGTLTGLLGAGGGFILIPTMVILIGLHMSNAVSTSLALISLNMIIGFAGYFHHSKYIDWNLLITITSFAILGMIIGHLLQKKMNDNLLRKIFILVMVCTALYTLISELLLRQ